MCIKTFAIIYQNPARLSRVDDGIWFEMTRFGDVQQIEYLDQARLVELVESLLVEP